MKFIKINADNFTNYKKKKKWWDFKERNKLFAQQNNKEIRLAKPSATRQTSCMSKINYTYEL